MSINREFDLKKSARVALVLGAVAGALVFSPNAKAGVHVGFSLNFDLPPGVHVSVGNYEPYYVGRVFYAPLAVWRPVYSFPVATPYGVVYQPYVYQDGRVVCHDYIPGPEAGYGQFIVEGRGRYNPGWYRGRSPYARSGYYGHDDRYGYHGDRGHDRYYGRDRGDDRGHDRGHGNSGGHHGKKHKH